jgi:hypothetical protein
MKSNKVERRRKYPEEGETYTTHIPQTYPGEFWCHCIDKPVSLDDNDEIGDGEGILRALLRV